MEQKPEKLADIQERFREISGKVEEYKLTSDEWREFITSTKHLDKTLQKQSKRLSALKIAIIVCCAAPILLIAACATEVIPHDTQLGVARFLVESVAGIEILEDDACIVGLNMKFRSYFRPPVESCSFCSDVKSVDKVADLTIDEFKEKYAYTGRPVIVRDGTRGWSAVDTFSFDFFRKIYTEDTSSLLRQGADCQFFPYRTNFDSLGEVLQMTPSQVNGSIPWYVGWSNCDASVANKLREHYKRPYFLPQESESTKYDWIFMGRPGYGAPMHVDDVDLPSWQAQIQGFKQWWLVPPKECYFQCKSKFTVLVRPGDIIVLDTNKWYHATRILGKDMSITIGAEYD